MNTISINSETIKTSDPYRVVPNCSRKIELKRSDTYASL